MSERTIWAVLTDGRYIRILINQSPGNTLLTLKADDSTDLAELCYQVVTGIPVGSKNGTESRTKSNMRLLADFLEKQLNNNLFNQLILIAPIATLTELQNVPPVTIFECSFKLLYSMIFHLVI